MLNTYLVYLRFLLIRGDLFEASYLAECERVREALVEEDAPCARSSMSGKPLESLTRREIKTPGRRKRRRRRRLN